VPGSRDPNASKVLQPPASIMAMIWGAYAVIKAYTSGNHIEGAAKPRSRMNAT
jgi:hypothetical protein